jgi:hypothetical protein
VIVAVKVTDWPNVDGFALEVSAVVVPFTVTVHVPARVVVLGR